MYFEEISMLVACHTLRSQFLTLFAVLLIILISILSVGKSVHGQRVDGAPIIHNTIHADRLVLAFYYAWYQHNDWCSCHMSDLPTIRYNSTDDATIERQINWAATCRYHWLYQFLVGTRRQNRSELCEASCTFGDVREAEKISFRFNTLLRGRCTRS